MSISIRKAGCSWQGVCACTGDTRILHITWSLQDQGNTPNTESIIVFLSSKPQFSGACLRTLGDGGEVVAADQRPGLGASFRGATFRGVVGALPVHTDRAGSPAVLTLPNHCATAQLSVEGALQAQLERELIWANSLTE